MTDVVYEDGTAVPSSVASHLSQINEGQHIVAVYKDGRQYSGRVNYFSSRSTADNTPDVHWEFGGRPLMDVYYTPFKVVVRDKEILTLVNFADYDFNHTD